MSVRTNIAASKLLVYTVPVKLRHISTHTSHIRINKQQLGISTEEILDVI